MNLFNTRIEVKEKFRNKHNGMEFDMAVGIESDMVRKVGRKRERELKIRQRAIRGDRRVGERVRRRSNRSMGRMPFLKKSFFVEAVIMSEFEERGDSDTRTIKRVPLIRNFVEAFVAVGIEFRPIVP